MKELRPQENPCWPVKTSMYVDDTWAAFPALALEGSPLREYVESRGFIEEDAETDCHATSDALAVALHELGFDGRRCYGYMPTPDDEAEWTGHHSWVEIRREDMFVLMSQPASENYERLERNCMRCAINKTRGFDWVAIDAKRLNPDGSELLHLPLRLRWFQRMFHLKRTVARMPFALCYLAVPGALGRDLVGPLA
jgi:hypothetical protein